MPSTHRHDLQVALGIIVVCALVIWALVKFGGITTTGG